MGMKTTRPTIKKLSNGTDWTVFTTGPGRKTTLVQNSAGESFELDADRASEVEEVLLETGYGPVAAV